MRSQITTSSELPRAPRHVGRVVSLLLLGISLLACRWESTDLEDQPSGENRRIPDTFFSLMNRGKNYLQQGDAVNALAIYTEAVALVPTDPDVHLNLANVHLLNGSETNAIREADLVLSLEPNSAAAYFVKGSAFLRLQDPEEAVKALENSLKIDPGVTAAFFQLGVARMGLQQWDEAITAFREGIRLEPNRLHSSARYLLAQSLMSLGKTDEAQRELELHSGSVGEGPSLGGAVFERSKHTRARVPFRLDQPDREGIEVKFLDASEDMLGDAAQGFSGPIGLIDLDHTGWTSLFVVEDGVGFRLLENSNGTFSPHPLSISDSTSMDATRILVGDIQNDRQEDIVVLGKQGSRVFKLAENGVATDLTSSSGIQKLGAIDGLLIDLDFTGKLDLVAVSEQANEVQVLRQSDPFIFTSITSSSGIPGSLRNVEGVLMEDWNRDQVMDLIVGRRNQSPLLVEKQRGGTLIPSAHEDWPEGAVFCAGDLDNDLRPDLAVLNEGGLSLSFNGGERREISVSGATGFHTILPFDYDNDGWLDLWAVGDSIRVWRNLGLRGFQERTGELGLDAFSSGAIAEIHFADFDQDCDSDAIVALVDGGLRVLRNEGGNANAQVKVQMVGNRSNASGIGCKIEIETGGLRLIRTVHQLPVEVGVGTHQQLDSFLVHWFNWAQGSAEVPVDCSEPLLALELTIQEGSCPYLYAWDGNEFRFITDILGSAPLGLPIAQGRYIEADPVEWVWIGNEQTFREKDGVFQLRITEELREVLYLDEVKLVVVDHEPGTEVHSTNKLLPASPFPEGELMSLHEEHPLLRAEDLEGRDVTSALRTVEGQRVSPPRLRSPQLRGLAEPYGWILDFGAIDVDQSLVLVMNGWLRFGGGMANIAASLEPSLPFPFPTLEAEVAPGVWSPVDVVVGAPSGKTKTILVDLSGKLPANTMRLRLKSAFEIHWDRIALMEKKPNPQTRITQVASSKADLRFRGFSRLKELTPDWPLTPDYDQVTTNSVWTIIPAGWCTRYGDVSELIQSRDEGLLIMNSGDELTLEFSAASLPPKAPGSIREFFLYADGWDKDSDFHVKAGTQVEPLPFHGMDAQRYGSQTRPAFPSDTLYRKYNTRWVDGKALQQMNANNASLSSKSSRNKRDL